MPPFPLLRQYLDGICASSPHEARLGREEFQREVHAFAAAFSESDIRELAVTSDHLVFNSFAQLERFGLQAKTDCRQCRPEAAVRIAHQSRALGRRGSHV